MLIQLSLSLAIGRKLIRILGGQSGYRRAMFANRRVQIGCAFLGGRNLIIRFNDS